MEERQACVWRMWVDAERKVVSFREDPAGRLVEFRDREMFLRCVDEYTRRGYRYQ